MLSIFLGVFSVILLLLCGFIVLLVLMQRPSANSGMGAALGGGAAEQAFGGETTNVLTRGTIYSIIGFFVICLLLYLAAISTHHQQIKDPTPGSIRGLAGSAEAAAEAVALPVVDGSEEIVPEEPAVSQEGATGPALSLDEVEAESPGMETDATEAVPGQRTE